MKQIFTDNLLYGGNRISKNKINWGANINQIVKFIYDDIEGEIKIINYYKKNNKYYLDIKYNNNIQSIYPSDFLKCALGNLLKMHTKEYRYQVGDIITDINSGKLEILEQIRISHNRKKGKCYYEKGYKYKCLICKNENIILESNLINKHGCNVCSSKNILVGFNDMWTINPKLAKLLANPNDGYKYTQNSHDKVNWSCLECGNIIKNKTISNINNQGLSCPKCGDGLSYPEKIMYSVLKDLNINFIYQYSPEWCIYGLNDKTKTGRYDFYFELNDNKYIIEMDGGLGHGNIIHNKSKLTREETKQIDDYKDKLADEHNIQVIRINCNYNYDRFEYIKNKIISSKLNNIFDLSKIDWLECHEFACNSLVKKACDLWTDGIHSTVEIGEILHLDRQTICKYLKQGKLINWCNYNPKLSCIKKVICLNNKLIFISIKEASEKMETNNAMIGECCKNKRKSAGKDPITKEKLRWMYYEDYLKLNDKVS